MKVIIYFLILSISINYAVETEFLPNPFLTFGQQKTFETNSSKWVEQFGLTADSQKQHFKALHAWCYLHRNGHSKYKNKIINLLDRLKKPLLKYLFIALYDNLDNTNLKGGLKRDVHQFLDYLVFREKIFRGLKVDKSSIRNNEYALSDFYYHQFDMNNHKFYLSKNRKDPFNIFKYHRLRLTLYDKNNKSKNSRNLSIGNDFFSAHINLISHLDNDLDSQDTKPNLIDAEHINLLIRTQNYIPNLSIISKYPYLLLSLIGKSEFVFTDDHWKIFLKLLQNPFWTKRIKFMIDRYSHPKSKLRRNLGFLLPHIFSDNSHYIISTKVHTESGVKLHYSDDTPNFLLNNVLHAVKNIDSSIVLSIRWLNIKVPFIFDPIESELIISTKSIYWSADVWKKVILRNRLYLKILEQQLDSANPNKPLPPLWLIDSIVNSISNWSPQIHGVKYEQAQHLSLFPLSISSLYNSARNKSRPNLFYAYHWQCRKIGQALFSEMNLSEILNKVRHIKISPDKPQLLYQRLSVYFNTPINELKNLIPQ